MQRSTIALLAPPRGRAGRRTGSSPPELGALTAPVVPPTGAVPFLRRSMVARGRLTRASARLGPSTPPPVNHAVHRPPSAAASRWPSRRALPHGTERRPLPRSSACSAARAGSGASTLTAALGWRPPVTVGRSSASMAHLGSGGLDVTACVEHQAGLRWGDLAGAQGEIDGEALICALPRCGGARVLGARPARLHSAPGPGRPGRASRPPPAGGPDPAGPAGGRRRRRVPRGLRRARPPHRRHGAPPCRRAGAPRRWPCGAARRLAGRSRRAARGRPARGASRRTSTSRCWPAGRTTRGWLWTPSEAARPARVPAPGWLACARRSPAASRCGPRARQGLGSPDEHRHGHQGPDPARRGP